MASENVAEHGREAGGGFRLPQVSLNTVILLTALAFFWITGNGVLHGGMNPDDWRQVGRVPPEWGGAHGRWAMDLLYRYLFQTRFVEPLQLVLVYGCFLYIALTLARAAVGERYLGLAAVGVFLAGVNHPYMTDVLNFSAHIFGYPLALALSLLAFSMAACGRPPRRLALKVLGVVLAGQLLAISLALYPSFALFGLMLPMIALIRVDRVDHRQAVRLVTSAAVVGLTGLLIYLLEWRAYTAFAHFYSSSDFRDMDHYEFVRPSIETILLKAGEYGEFLKTIYGGALWNIRPANIFYESIALVIAGVWATAAVVDMTRRAEASDKALSLLRRTLGIVGAAIVIPTLFWFTYVELYAPPRTFALVGFTAPIMLLTCVASAQGLLPGALSERAMLWLGIAPTLLLATVSVFISAAMWNDQQRVADRDVAIATSIYARLAALPGFDGESFTVAGSRQESALRWGVSVGWSSTEYSPAHTGIYRGLLGYPGRVDVVLRSPAPCHAFPASDATFLYEGHAVVCLSDDDGFFPLGRCEPVRGRASAMVCAKTPRRAVVKITGDCSRSAMRHLLVTTAGGRVETVDFPVKGPSYRDFAHDSCFYEVDADDSAIVSIKELTEDGHVLWTHALQPQHAPSSAKRGPSSAS